MTKIAKGVECFWFRQYDRNGSVSYQRVVVESWGKKEGTVRRNATGEMARELVYVNRQADQFVPVANCADPAAEAMTRAQASAAYWAAHYNQRIAAHPNERGYTDLMREHLAQVKARTVNLDDAASVAAFREGV